MTYQLISLFGPFMLIGKNLNSIWDICESIYVNYLCFTFYFLPPCKNFNQCKFETTVWTKSFKTYQCNQSTFRMFFSSSDFPFVNLFYRKKCRVTSIRNNILLSNIKSIIAYLSQSQIVWNHYEFFCSWSNLHSV